jgi:hypothetical protein
MKIKSKDFRVPEGDDVDLKTYPKTGVRRRRELLSIRKRLEAREPLRMEVITPRQSIASIELAA